MATLSAAIRCVVRSGSKEKVRRVDARWIVATVKNVKTIRDWAVMERPTTAVRRDKFPSLSRQDLAITMRGLGASPDPALTRNGMVGSVFVYLAPKALLNGNLFRSRFATVDKIRWHDVVPLKPCCARDEGEVTTLPHLAL
jgi:hypothetical protein